MDQSEGNVEQELGSPCSSDKESSSSSESKKIAKKPSSSQNLDVNDYETMEELDFEDERRDCDVQKYANILQTSVQQNIISDSQNSTSPKKNGEGSVENNTQTELKSTGSEKEDSGKENCSASDIEEGETLDEGECVDKEDGEIDEVSKTEDLQKYSCRFFQRGKCIWGKDCRYLHLSDKGLYNMFESPVKRKKPPIPRNMNFVSEVNYVVQPPPPPIELEKIPESLWVDKSTESGWDRALHEAKERIKLSKMRKDSKTFDGNMHVKVEKDDKFVGNLRNSGYSRDRPFSPEPIPERVVCTFTNRYDLNKSERPKYGGNSARPNMSKNTGNVGKRKFGCDSEWRDPWRRSKTPPKHKGLTSKSFSDSSSVSSENSHSSFDRASRGRHSPPLKCSKTYKPVGRGNHSRSYGRKESPQRTRRTSSCSDKGSTSSHSRSSSPKFDSSIYNNRSKQSRSPVFHKRKGRRSPDSIVLPYSRKRSRSVSQDRRRVFSKVEPVERKNIVLPKQSPSYHSRSRSHSSSKSRGSSYSRSGSDITISDISDSSLSKTSSCSDTDVKNKCGMRGSDTIKIKQESYNSKISAPRSGDTIPRIYRSPNQDKSFRSEPAPPVTDSKIQPKPKNKKRIKGLEMDLLKYNAKRMSPPAVTESKPPPQPTQNVGEATISKKSEVDLNSQKRSIKAEMELVDKRPSKRDLLMQQLRAVEEAIARKKKYVGST